MEKEERLLTSSDLTSDSEEGGVMLLPECLREFRGVMTIAEEGGTASGVASLLPTIKNQPDP